MSKKKIKVLKKKKVKESKKKTQIKKIKKDVKILEVKGKKTKLKSNIENLEEEINDENFSRAIQPNKSPVLEQIAVSSVSNLEQIIPIRRDSDEELSGTGTDYTQLGALRNDKNKYQESSPNYDEIANLDKDEKKEERRFGESNFEFELRNKKNGESKKYLNKNDYQ